MNENLIFLFSFVLLYIKRPRDACDSGSVLESFRHRQNLAGLGFGRSFRLEKMVLLPTIKKLASCILVWCSLSISEIAPCKVTMWATAALNGISALPHKSSGQL